MTWEVTISTTSKIQLQRPRFDSVASTYTNSSASSNGSVNYTSRIARNKIHWRQLKPDFKLTPTGERKN